MPTSCSPTPPTGARAQQGPCRTPLLSPSTENLLVTIFIATNKQIIQINETYVLTAYTLARYGPTGLRLSARLLRLTPTPASQHAQADAFACQHASSLRLSLSARSSCGLTHTRTKNRCAGKPYTELAASLPD